MVQVTQKGYLLILLMLISCLGISQERLSLSEAIAKGLQNNYAIQIAAQDQRIAANDNSWGNAGRWPSLDFSIPFSYNRFNNPGSFLAGRENLNGNLNLSWTVFDGFAINANKARFALLEEQSAGNAAVIIENNIQAIILGYNNVLVAQAQLEVLQEVLDNSRERLSYEEYRKDLGTGSTFELFQFRNAVIVDSANVITQVLNLRNARRNLNLIMGEAVDIQFAFTDSIQTTFPSYNISNLQERMFSSNNNLKNQLITQQLREQETRLAKAALYPRLALSAGTTYTLGNVILRNRDPDTRDEMPTFTNSVNAFDYSAGLTLSFNLFNGRNTRRLIQNAKINQQIAVLQKDEMKQSLSSELWTHHDNYEARIELLDLQRQGAENARTALDLGEERFGSGLINSFDYRSIQLQYLNAELARLDALRNLKESQTELIRLIGGLVAEQ